MENEFGARKWRNVGASSRDLSKTVDCGKRRASPARAQSELASRFPERCPDWRGQNQVFTPSLNRHGFVRFARGQKPAAKCSGGSDWQLCLNSLVWVIVAAACIYSVQPTSRQTAPGVSARMLEVVGRIHAALAQSHDAPELGGCRHSALRPTFRQQIAPSRIRVGGS